MTQDAIAARFGIRQGHVSRIDVLRVTDSAAINPLTITCWGYEV